MQKLQDSIFSITKTTNLSPAVFNFLQPSDNCTDKTPLGGILRDSRHGWLALGPKFCVIDLKTGLKIAARSFGSALSNFNITVTSVVELPTPLTDNSQQLIISLECEDVAGMICVFHVNGSQILRCIQTEVVITKLAVCDSVPDGPFTCFNGVIMAGTKSGEVIAFDLNRASLIQAMKDISQGYEHLVRNETNPAHLTFLSPNASPQIEQQRDLALENDDHIAVLLNEDSLVDNQYIFHNPDGTVRMKAKRDHIRVSALQYIPQLASLVIGYNFGAFQIWNLMTLDLEFTSQVNVECLPVTHFGFQEPCDDPRAFCYLWVIFSLIDRFEEEQFPLAVMYSLTYQGKRILPDTKYLYQKFSTATIRFQIELGTFNDDTHLVGGRCVSCHSYSINSTLGDEGEDSMLNICQLVWECWGENANTPTQYNMLLFDLDQWYKDQMPASQQLQSNAFMSACRLGELCGDGRRSLDVRLQPASVTPYSHAMRLEEHFYPNSLQYNCVCLNTSETYVLSTIGVQRQIIASMDEEGPTVLLSPNRLYNACITAGLTPLYMVAYRNVDEEQQRRFLLSVMAEARLARLLVRCAHHWATSAHAAAGCTLTFLIDWCWTRAIELKENAKELIAPLFTSSTLPDRNVIRCLEHCVQQLTQLTSLLDAVLTKCCNLMIPEALSETEARARACSAASAFLQATQWCMRVGLLPEQTGQAPYPAQALHHLYNKRRLKLQRLLGNPSPDEGADAAPCPLLYIDQLIEHEFGGERIRKMWMRGGSEWRGLYPPPSLYSLLRLYLLPDVAEEHKHSLVLYLLVDYSMIYDDVRYGAVIRRLMQFPTMFGLSNTAIKATQAFWHLDHREFDFALDQLQCLTGNTLSEWQHNVVLSALLVQKKTQAALQYLHVRKPAPLQNLQNVEGDVNKSSNRVNDHDKLEDWQSCCDLYLARGLVIEALDVIRMCVQNAANLDDKMHILNYFFKGCRNTGHLSNVLQIPLLPFEEEMFIKYLDECNEPQTSEILIMYYLQQARYLEAQQYNNKLKQNKAHPKELSTSVESLLEGLNRDSARDALVEAVCESLPSIANIVARTVLSDTDIHTNVIAPKPMSVFVQAKSSKNTFTYKSSFIQDTIENASETWINKPITKRGLKRVLNIEETPFICTPKLTRTRSIFSPDRPSESSPPKRAKLDPSTPKTPKPGSTIKVSEELSQQMSLLLDMPEVHTPARAHSDRSGAITPQSILKIRRSELDRDVPSPVDSRYLGDTDDELLETASNHTHYSDSTNKHLRFTIPTTSEEESSPSPPTAAAAPAHAQNIEKDKEEIFDEKEMDLSIESYTTTASHPMEGTHPLESPPKKLAIEETVKTRKSYKDSVRARRSFSVSVNSSLSDDPSTSVESIADIPIMLINPRYSGEREQKHTITDTIISEEETKDKTENELKKESELEIEDNTSENVSPPRTPKCRRAIRSLSESTPLINRDSKRARSVTPDRPDSPVSTPLRSKRITRSRSRTPSVSPRSSPLAPILEQPIQELESEPHPQKSLLVVPRQTRSRSRTPERVDKGVADTPRLEAIKESPSKSPYQSPTSSPTRRSLRSRSCTPEIVTPEKIVNLGSPRNLRSRSKTPEKLIERPTRNKPLSRLVLEHNTFAKTKQQTEENEPETIVEKITDSAIEYTPCKISTSHTLMDITFSPIVHKSVLHSSTETLFSETDDKNKATETSLEPLPAFITISETHSERSVLRSYESSVDAASPSETVDAKGKNEENKAQSSMKSLPNFTINETYIEKSVLHSYESSANITETSESESTSKESKAKIVSEEENIDISTKDVEVISRDSCKSVPKDVDRLITNDSDIEYETSTEVEGWKTVVDSQDTATVIQKEKTKIGEIEREISEIEGDMSGDRDDDTGSSEDEEILPFNIEAEEDNESTEESEEEKSLASDIEEEIISINDTSDESSSGSDIDEQSSTSSSNKEQAEKITFDTIEEVYIEDQKVDEGKKDAQEIDANDDISVDLLNQGHMSLITDDSSFLADSSELKLNYSDKYENDKEETLKSDIHSVQIEVTANELVSTVAEEDTSKGKPILKDIDVVDALLVGDKSPKADIPKFELDEQKPVESSEETEMIQTEDAEKTADCSTKRAKSPSRIFKENDDSNVTEEKEIIKTPMTRKRTKSTSSNKSVDLEKTLEKIDTPSKKRAKTPTSAEIRRIMTRRLSKELAERSKELEDSSKPMLDESISTTPKKRSTRSRSKIDDNASVASDSSNKSKGKMSEDAGDMKPAQVRKARKSILASKSELPVIKEMTTEESTKEEKDKDISDIFETERLTRHQKSELESLLNPSLTRASPRRRPSTASHVSARTERSDSVATEHDDEDASSTSSIAFDVQPIDRISLLNKQEFKGSPDVEEFTRAGSPESITSEPSRQRPPRLARAASEARATPKAAKKTKRNVSVDVAAVSDSPARGRRASFTRAVEALHTPKTRRASTDLKKAETESQQGSPAPSDGSPALPPARRARRASATSQPKSGSDKRSKK